MRTPTALAERRVLVVDADPALFELLAEWLEGHGFRVVGPGAAGHVDLIVIDVPFPRRSGVQALGELATRYPDTPVLLMSSSFFPGIECCGPSARKLGVAAVLPKPVTRDALLAAVDAALRTVA